MNVIPPNRLASLLAVASFTTLLAACGGGSSGESATAADPAGPNMYSTLQAGGEQGSDPGARSHEASASSSETGDVAPSPAAAAPSGEAAAGAATTASSDDPEGPFGQDASAYVLTFEDHFDGELNTGVWNTSRTDTEHSVTNYATEGGVLRIWPERGSNGDFFDRTLDTADRFSQRYGYFEIEAKLPRGRGVWPAFWLFNQIGERRPEIDIMEAYPGGEAPWSEAGEDGHPVATMYAPVVWNDPSAPAGYAKVPTPNLSAGFHRYAVKWEPNRATFYFDGQEVYSLDVSVSDPLYLIIDLWFGSASGSPDDTTPTGLGNAFEINYVKAWQFK